MKYAPEGMSTISGGSSVAPCEVPVNKTRAAIATHFEKTKRRVLDCASIFEVSLENAVTKIAFVWVASCVGAIRFISFKEMRLGDRRRFWTGRGMGWGF